LKKKKQKTILFSCTSAFRQDIWQAREPPPRNIILLGAKVRPDQTLQPKNTLSTPSHAMNASAESAIGVTAPNQTGPPLALQVGGTSPQLLKATTIRLR